MRIGFIGAGRVGCSMGMMLKDTGADVAGFYSRSADSAASAAKLTESKAFSSLEELCGRCDALFITTPDSAINSVWNSIKKHMRGKTVCHMSGALSSGDAFPDAENIKTASVHPLLAVSDREHSYKELKNAFFTIEGSAADEMAALLEDSGCRVYRIDEASKPRYHAAAAIASNLMVSLLKMSCEELEKCGFSETDALSALKALAMGNAKNVFELGFEKSLTGPLERCDTATVKKHLDLLNGDTRAAYITLSRHLLETAKRKNPDTNYSVLEEELQ